MGGGSYRTFDHTADLGIEVMAPSFAALFETAAAALFDVLTDARAIRPRLERHLAVTGADRVELLVRWLSELLYLHDTEGLLFVRFRVKSIEENALSAIAEGEPYEPGRHEVRTEVKAVTYHQAAIVEASDGWLARFVIDV